MQSTSGFQLSILQTWSSCHESKVSSSVYLQKCISLISQALCIVHCISLQCVITARLSAKTTAASHVAKQEAPWLSCELFGPLMIHIVMRNYLIELWAFEQVFAKAVVLDLEFIIGEYPWLNTNHRLCIVFQNCSLRLSITNENNLFVCTQYPAWRTRFFQWLVQNDGLTVQRAWPSAALWFEWEKVPEKVKSKSPTYIRRF